MRYDSLALLHASFATVFNKKTDIAGRFYENLFRDAPEARGLFSDDLTRQKEMFASMLTEIVSCAETPVAFADKVKSLGESHKRYKIPAAHFDIAGKALLGALSVELDGLLSSAEMRAWNLAAEAMTEAMSSASAA